jgi:hypothetical protein
MGLLQLKIARDLDTERNRVQDEYKLLANRIVEQRQTVFSSRFDLLT